MTQTAGQLGITRLALRGRVRRRQIPFLRIGRKTYFNPKRLRQWLDGRIVDARPQKPGRGKPAAA
jgi:hypothetical protein